MQTKLDKVVGGAADAVAKVIASAVLTGFWGTFGFIAVARIIWLLFGWLLPPT